MCGELTVTEVYWMYVFVLRDNVNDALTKTPNTVELHRIRVYQNQSPGQCNEIAFGVLGGQQGQG